MDTEKYFENWKKLQPFSFYFDPEINKVTCSLDSNLYDFKPLINPCEVKFLNFGILPLYFLKVTKKDVDESRLDTSLPFLKFKATLKAEQKEPIDLDIIFKGMNNANSLTVTSDELQAIEDIKSINYKDIYLYYTYFPPPVSKSIDLLEKKNSEELLGELTKFCTYFYKNSLCY